MKRINLLLLALSISAVVLAQNKPIGSSSARPMLTTPMATKVRFGIKAGVNLATLEIDDDDNPNMNTNLKTSFHGGVFVNVPLSSAFSVQPELLFSGQGSKTSQMTSNVPDLAGINELDFHYLSLPVMFQWKSTGGFLVELGPQFSYLLTANGDRPTGGEVDLKDKDFVKKTDLAAAAGIGYLSRIGLGINARYVNGFSNVWNNDDSQYPSLKDNKYKNRVIQIGLTYHFGAAK